MKMLVQAQADLDLSALHWLEQKVRPGSSLYVPAGRTPLGLYRLLDTKKPKFFDSIRLLQIDEVITGPAKNRFAKFFAEHLPFWRKNLVPIQEADEVADFAILGFGVNGHVGFHEPFLPAGFRAGCVKLTPEAAGVLGLAESPWAVTHGLGHFMLCKSVLLIIAGEGKGPALKAWLSDQLSSSVLKRHPDLTVLIEKQYEGILDGIINL